MLSPVTMRGQARNVTKMHPENATARHPTRRQTWTLSVLLAAVFAVKTAVLLQLRNHPLLAPDAGLDTTAYVQLANKVLDGDLWLGPGLYYVSPLYIYFLAAALALFHSFTAVRFAQIVLGAAAVAGVFVMTQEWFGRRAAWIAAALAGLTGVFTFYEVLILQSSIDVCLTSLGLSALALGLNRGRNTWIAAAGIVLGIQTLNRPNVLLAGLGVCCALLVCRRLRPALLLAAGLALGVSPAFVRNAVVAHQWSVLSSHGGLNFYIGNSSTATGFYHPVPGIMPTIGGQETDARRVAERAVGHALSDSEVSSYFYGLGRDWILGHPFDAAGLFARKLAYVFNAAHVALPHSYPFYAHDERTLLRFLAVGPWLLIPLGLVGLVLCAPGRHRAAYLAWTAFVPAYAAAVAIFFVAERYRLPLLVPLAAGAGAAIDRAVTLGKRHQYRKLSIGAVTVAMMLLFVNWPLGLDDGRWQEGVRLAQRLVILHRYDEADAWVRRLELREPASGATEHDIGAQLLVQREFARAVPHLQRAILRGYDGPTIDYEVGTALLETGDASGAVAHLRRAVDSGLQTETPLAGLAYARALQATGDRAGTVIALRRLRLPEDDADAWTRAGRLAVSAHAPEDAEPFFAHAAAIRPDDAAVRQQHGLNLLVLERIPEAARELEAASRLDPRDPDTLSRLAYCELKLGRVGDARAHASAALALNPGDRLARELLRAAS